MQALSNNHPQNMWDKLVFMWNGALGEKSDVIFQKVLASIEKKFILAGILGTSL